MTAVLLYDGTSGFCSSCARGIQRWVRPDCVVLPYQRVDLAGWHLTAERADADVILARRLGDVVLIDTGLDALIEALASGRGPWPSGARVLRARGVRPHRADRLPLGDGQPVPAAVRGSRVRPGRDDPDRPGRLNEPAPRWR